MVGEIDDSYARMVYIKGGPENYRVHTEQMRKPGRTKAIMTEYRNFLVGMLQYLILQALPLIA